MAGDCSCLALSAEQRPGAIIGANYAARSKGRDKNPRAGNMINMLSSVQQSIGNLCNANELSRRGDAEEIR
jgi:hypothetical protein